MILPLVVLVLGASPACGAKTPEDALRRLEDAYRAKDLELAVACKDFEREAKIMLVQKTAQTLEQA